MKLASLLLGVVPTVCLAAPIEPPAHWTLVAPVPHVLRPGAKVSVLLQCHIDPTWHIYALDQPEDGPVSTEIGLSDSGGIQLLSVDQQTPRAMSDSFYHRQLSFFEQSAQFTLHLKLPTAPLPPGATLRVAVRYQACNDKVCLAPRSVLVDLPLVATQR